jgi:hypothetical protein
MRADAKAINRCERLAQAAGIAVGKFVADDKAPRLLETVIGAFMAFHKPTSLHASDQRQYLDQAPKLYPGE